MKKPILGWGTSGGSTAVLLSKNLTQGIAERKVLSRAMAAPHNQFLLFGVENGLMGMAIFVYFLWELFRTIRTQKSDYIRIFGYGFLIAFCIVCVSSVGLFISAIGDYFMLMATWLTAESIRNSNTYQT